MTGYGVAGGRNVDRALAGDEALEDVVFTVEPDPVGRAGECGDGRFGESAPEARGIETVTVAGGVL